MKKISVLMPCYNCAEFITETLNSILNQTLKTDDYEIIIIDDGSTDDSVHIIQSLIANYENVFFLPRKKNLGIIKTRNELLNLAKGRSELIAWCDADDVYHSNKLLGQYNYIKSRNLIGCGTWYKKFGVQNRSIIKFINPAANRVFSIFGTPVGFPTFMHKNNLDIFFDESLESSEDYDFVAKVCQLGDVGNFPKFYTYYRTHIKQESTKHLCRQKRAHISISKKIFKEYYSADLSAQNWIDFPRVSTIDETKAILQMQKVYCERNNIIFNAIIDYRFIVFNKNKMSCLFYYLAARNIKLLNICMLFKGK
ncbi:hypothetical protein OA46_04015 [Enterobacter cloacae]|nr:hypothetical protein OA46_04015 [Enterobacter cloacae]